MILCDPWQRGEGWARWRSARRRRGSAAGTAGLGGRSKGERWPTLWSRWARARDPLHHSALRACGERVEGRCVNSGRAAAVCVTGQCIECPGVARQNCSVRGDMKPLPRIALCGLTPDLLYRISLFDSLVVRYRIPVCCHTYRVLFRSSIRTPQSCKLVTAAPLHGNAIYF